MKIFLKKLLYKFLRRQEIEAKYTIVSLGSEYGNWKFLNLDNLYNSTIISAGAGEDISFDIEFINMYKSKVIFVDPTPKALQHLNMVKKGLGKPKTEEYVDGGSQKINSYNLEKVSSKDFIILNKALWNKSKKILKFYFPDNNNYVSNTLIKNPLKRKKSRYISVESIELSEIILKEELEKLVLIKIDIEGAEVKVVSSMMKKQIYPIQILLEIDYIRKNTIYSIIKSFLLISKLIIHGYKLIKIKEYENYLFVRKEVFN